MRMDMANPMRNYYRYRDYRSRRIVFECTAASIFEADIRMRKATGIDPWTAGYIGVSVDGIGWRNSLRKLGILFLNWLRRGFTYAKSLRQS